MVKRAAYGQGEGTGTMAGAWPKPCAPNPRAAGLIPGPQEGTVSGDGIFKEVIKVHEVMRVAPTQSDRCPHKKRRSRHRHTQRTAP